MKKLHFSLMAILFALFSMVSFTACSSDDDDTPSAEDAIAFEFKQGGIFNEYVWTGSKWKIECSGEAYTISGNTSYPSTITFKKIK